MNHSIKCGGGKASELLCYESWSVNTGNTAKLLFHQSPTRHCDYTVTGQ